MNASSDRVSVCHSVGFRSAKAPPFRGAKGDNLRHYPTSIRRRGFSLIELLCVMVLISVIGLVLTLILRDIFAIERIQAAGFNKILETNALADQFRADVHQAESTLAEWQDYTASERTLILQLKDGGRIIYLWENDRLLRRAFERGVLSERAPPSADRQARVEFVRDGREPKLVRLRVHRMLNGEIVPGQSIEIAAALGGDWR